ncbi:hypothetical protein AAG570_005005 [Ranatra chinensis]|uniref:Uncharacterized protein n=1 Tax=Ranatra chinensis TaxID=642074 RepID=A0ABD0YE44_9HEMI
MFCDNENQETTEIDLGGIGMLSKVMSGHYDDESLDVRCLVNVQTKVADTASGKGFWTGRIGFCQYWDLGGTGMLSKVMSGHYDDESLDVRCLVNVQTKVAGGIVKLSKTYWQRTSDFLNSLMAVPRIMEAEGMTRVSADSVSMEFLLSHTGRKGRLRRMVCGLRRDPPVEGWPPGAGAGERVRPRVSPRPLHFGGLPSILAILATLDPPLRRPTRLASVTATSVTRTRTLHSAMPKKETLIESRASGQKSSVPFSMPPVNLFTVDTISLVNVIVEQYQGHEWHDGRSHPLVTLPDLFLVHDSTGVTPQASHGANVSSICEEGLRDGWQVTEHQRVDWGDFQV